MRFQFKKILIDYPNYIRESFTTEQKRKPTYFSRWSMSINYLDKPNWAVGMLVITTIVFHYGMYFFICCYTGATEKLETTYPVVKYHKMKGKNLLR